MNGSALDVEKAVPKSITLTFMGSGRRFVTMMLLGCKSPWIRPMLASASSAVATLKYNIKDTVQRQQNPLNQHKVQGFALFLYLLDDGSDFAQV